MLDFIVKVAIDNATFRFDIMYSYLCDTKISVGQKVFIPFGRGNKERKAIVLEIEEIDKENIDKKIKKIISVIDEPPLSDEMLKLMFFLKNKTFCTYYDAVKLMTPKGIGTDINVKYKIDDDYQKFDLTENEITVINHILDKKSKPSKTFVKENQKIISKLIEKSVVVCETIYNKNFKDNLVNSYFLSDSYNAENEKITKRQQE